MHRRAVTSSICATILLLAVGCGREANDEAPAAPALVQSFASAADALEARTGKPGERSDMPAASDPVVQTFDEQTGKAMTALGTDALPIDGFASFDRLCGRTANIVASYALAGTQGLAGPAQQQRMIANVEQRLDQIFTPLLFSAHCTAEHLPFLEGRIDASDPAKLQAVKQVQDGVAQQVLGLLQMASDSSVDADKRRRIMELAVADAPKFALGLTAAQRAQLAAAAKEVEKMLPAELRPHAQKLGAQITQAECGKICSAL